MPNAERAVVPESKIRDYLLSPEHEDGKHKAAFFLGFGFRREDWQSMKSALLEHIELQEVTGTKEDEFGIRYTVEGPIVTPDRRSPMVRSVWIILRDEAVPRFVSAYPL